MPVLSCIAGIVGPYLIAFGKPAGHREVAPREFDVHSLGGSPREKQKRKEGEDEEEYE